MIDAPRSETELDELLSAPTPETVAAVSRLRGDLLVLGAGGKMGSSLARLARRSLDEAGLPHRVVCVSRFGSVEVARRLREQGIETIACDLLNRERLAALPDAPNVLFLAGFKFGASGAPHRAWALNGYLPALVAERFREARIVALSTGNVYPYVSPGAAADEDTPPEPIGEYAQSCLARERMFEHMSETHGTRSVLIRLNYATDLRYGVLVDIATRVRDGREIDVTTGWLNTIWQGEANAVLLRAFDLCAAPPDVLNLTGPETLSVRESALELADLMSCPTPSFSGEEGTTALLSDASRCWSLYGAPGVTARTLIEWTASWVADGLPTLGKPTRFETRDGRF